MCYTASAQDKTVKTVPPRPTAALDGKTIFRQYCAVCHGVDAKGGGPAADALKQRPSDLTGISQRNGGKFPEDRVLASLKGEGQITAHGGPDMPVWGPIFSQMSTNLTISQARMHSLLSYLEGIQAK